MPAHEADPDRVLAPSLGYLRDIVARLPVEGDTAFVVMPFTAPYAGYYASFYRPALEHCGYRAFRAWGGLAGAEHADLLLALMGKAGLIWADVSELDHAVACEIGAAQALGKLGVIVVSEDRAAAVPAHVGRDPVVRYDPRDAGLAARHGAADVGVPGGDHAGGGARRPPAGHAELDRGRLRRSQPGARPDPAAAGRARGAAPRPAGDGRGRPRGRRSQLRRGLPARACTTRRRSCGAAGRRLGLGRFEEAAADLGAVLGRDPLAPPAGEWRPIAAYLRAVLREAQGDLAGALRDFELAVALGLTDADVRDQRDALAARVGS